MLGEKGGTLWTRCIWIRVRTSGRIL
jgi:hypothetical protein